MTLQPWFAQILVCPESKKPLIYFREEGFLFSPDSRLKYSIDEGVPVMLVDEAERVDETQAQALVDRAREQGLIG